MKNFFRKRWVYAVSVFLSFLLYLPLLPHLTTSLPSYGIRYAYLFNVKRGGEYILQGKLPIRFEEVYYPAGSTIYEGIFPSLLMSIMGIFMNPFLVQNILCLFSFILAGWGMYSLSFYLTKERLGSLLAGIYFSFSPFHIMLIDTVPPFSIEWVPLCLLYFFKSIENPFSWRFPLFFSIFLAFTTLSTWYYGLGTIIFTGIYVIFHIKSVKKTPLLKMGFFSFIFLFPFFLHILRLTGSYSGWKMDVIVRSSPDLLSFFIPSQNHPLFSRFFQEIYRSYKANFTFNSNYLTCSALLCAGIAAVRLRGMPRFFFFAFLFFFLFSLGPFIQIKGDIPSISGWKLKSLFYFLYHNFRYARASSRFALFSLLSLSIIFSFGMKYFKGKYGKGGKVIAGLFSIALLFEILPSPLRPFSREVPSFYTNLDNEKGDFSILEIPFSPYNYTILYYNMHHHKKVIGGAGDTSFPFFWNEITSYPFLHQLMTYHYQFGDEKVVYEDIIEEPAKYSSSIARYFKIKYAIIHKHIPHIVDNIYAGEFKDLFLSLDWKMIGEDRYIYIFAPPEGRKMLFPVIGKGWTHIQREKGYPIRWMKDREAEIRLISEEEGSAEIYFSMKCWHPGGIFLSVNEGNTEKLEVSSEVREFSFKIPLIAGENRIIFRSERNPCGIMRVGIRPADSSK